MQATLASNIKHFHTHRSYHMYSYIAKHASRTIFIQLTTKFILSKTKDQSTKSLVILIKLQVGSTLDKLKLILIYKLLAPQM